jgi:hypothetical protein
VFGDRELRAALQGPGTVQVTIGADSFQAFRDEESADVLTAGGEYTAQTVRRSVVAFTAEIPASVVVDADVVIDGVDAKVRQVVPMDDGAVSRIIYVKA